MTRTILQRHGLKPHITDYRHNVTAALASLVILPQGQALLSKLRKVWEAEKKKSQSQPAVGRLYPKDAAAIAVRELRRQTFKELPNWWKP